MGSGFSSFLTVFFIKIQYSMYNRGMKLSLLGGILLARLCAAVSLVSAGEGLSGIPEDKLRELESLHHTAEDMVAQNKFREALDVYTDIILLEPDDEVAYTHM